MAPLPGAPQALLVRLHRCVCAVVCHPSGSGAFVVTQPLCVRRSGRRSGGKRRGNVDIKYASTQTTVWDPAGALGGLACRLRVLFSSAAGGAYWPIAICCPSLGPFSSIGPPNTVPLVLKKGHPCPGVSGQAWLVVPLSASAGVEPIGTVHIQLWQSDKWSSVSTALSKHAIPMWLLCFGARSLCAGVWAGDGGGAARKHALERTFE